MAPEITKALPQSTIDRRELMPALLPDHDRYLIVAGLAGAAKDMAALTGEADHLITLGGAMGGAVSMGLGMALAAPDAHVLVVTGDGELMMNVGALATVASAAPGNLSVVCVDNASHGETGGQPGHTARRTSLALMAEGAGIPSVMTLSSMDEVDEARAFLADSPAPRFLWARVRPGPPTVYARNWNLADCRLRFRRAFLGRTG